MNDESLLSGTKREILEMLLDGPMTVPELANRLNINITAIREHLNNLAANNLVTYDFVNMGKGRPKKIYHITKQGVNLFPKRYDLLLKIFLDQLEKEMGHDWVKNFLSRAGENIISGFDTNSGLDGLLNFYNNLGCMAVVKVENDKTIIKRRNCIYYNLAIEKENLVCESFENSILNRIFPNYKVIRKDTVRPGKFDCEIIIEKNRDKNS